MRGASGDRTATLSSYVPQVVLRHVQTTAGEPSVPSADRFPAALMLIDITGFTPITAAAVRRGPSGVEQLSRSFNDYLGRIIDRTVEHGGDIAKIVGDALMPIWPAVDEDLGTASRRAAACGLAIAADLGEIEVEGHLQLALKVGLCAGEVVTSHVGGVGDQWLFLLAGDAVAQLSELERHMQTGDVIATPGAWSLISDRFVGQPMDDGHVRIRPTEQPVEPRPLASLPLSVEHEQALRSYVPQVLLSRVDAGQAEWLAELRRTTVVFANVRGIRHETPDAEQLVQRITESAQHVLHRYDGWLKEITLDDKGTTLIAVFGVPPYTHEDDAPRGVEAALAVQAELRSLGLGAGVSVTSGPTFCGPVGNSRRRDFAMLGGHVNLAARLMQASDHEGVLCDAATYEESSGRHSFERLPAYVLKGLSRPIDVYRARASVTAGRRSSTLVDRTSEMATAGEALAALRDGRGGLVLLEGEPGIGKSRLVEELLGRARELGVNTLVGTATDIDVTTPYNAWRGVFEQLLGVASVTDREARRSVALQRLRSADDALRLAPLLEPVLSIELADNDVTRQMSGSVRADNTRDLLIRLLRNETARGPLLIVLEDVHWLDSASWSLVVQVRAELPELLLVMTMRPVADAQIGQVNSVRDSLTSLRLGALQRPDAITLAAQRTGASELADAVARVVHERAEGNPLFIEQLTYAMRDAGLIVVDHGVLRAAVAGTALEGPIIPDTVQRVITTRLDQLSPTQALALKVASVIGQRFMFRTLADVFPLATDEAALMDDLETLTRLDLLAAVPGAPQPAYEFRHKVTQEVAYNLMPSGQSQGLHGRVAEWYERSYAEDISPFHAFLVYHWRRAGRPERAVDHLERAGAQAVRTFANEEAIGFLNEALALAAEHGLAIQRERQARWHLQLGEAHVNLSQYRQGREQLELGLGLMGRPVPNRAWRPFALLGQITRQLLHRAGLGRGATRLSDEQRQALVAACRAYERLAEAAYYGGGETLLPLYAAIRILNDAEASGSAPEIARGLAGTGALFGLVPLPRIADWYLRRALARLEQVDDLTTHEIVGIVAGFYYTGAGAWDSARTQFVTVRGIARRLGDRRRLHDALGNLAELEYLRGSLRSASEIGRELVGLAGARRDRRFEAEGLAVSAYCAWQLGDMHEALRAADQLKRMVAEELDLYDELRIKHYGVAALLHHAVGEHSQAIAAADEAMRLTASLRPSYFATFLGYAGPAQLYLDLWEAGQPGRHAEAQAEQALARLRRYAHVFPIGRPRHETLAGRRAWLGGRRGRAVGAWRRAIALAEQLSMPYEKGLAHLELGRHLAPDDAQRAIHLESARELFTRLEAAEPLARVEALAGSGTASPAARD